MRLANVIVKSNSISPDWSLCVSLNISTPCDWGETKLLLSRNAHSTHIKIYTISRSQPRANFKPTIDIAPICLFSHHTTKLALCMWTFRCQLYICKIGAKTQVHVWWMNNTFENTWFTPIDDETIREREKANVHLCLCTATVILFVGNDFIGDIKLLLNIKSYIHSSNIYTKLLIVFAKFFCVFLPNMRQVLPWSEQWLPRSWIDTAFVDYWRRCWWR